MTKYKTMDGNEACASIAYLFNEVVGIYPITPSSPMPELIDEWSNQGKKNFFNDQVKVVQMQSEAGAAGFVHGSLQSGLLTSTFTSSQGLLLMIPNMYKIAGEMLPTVFNVAARSLASSALSIFGDHQDVYATRMTGFAMLASSSVQQVMNMTAIAHLSAIESSLPFINFFDGFRTSHELKKIRVLEPEEIKPLINQEALLKFRHKALSPANILTRGTAQNDDVYFQAIETRNSDYEKLPDIVNKYMQEINKITGKNYQPFNYHGHPQAEDVIIAMGSVCDTIKETIANLNDNGYQVGLLEVHLYRPFSSKYFKESLPKGVKRIAVLDRTKEPGSAGEPLYLDVLSMFDQDKPLIIGGRYGLSSKDTNPSHIKAVYDHLKSNNPFHNFVVGIEDDVTNRSLKVNKFICTKNQVSELLIYGFGSDGMVSASKSIIKIIGDNTDDYVQGYFQYDSKKSGGVTRSHLRFSPQPIKCAYYVTNPRLVVCSKEKYIDQYQMIDNIKENGVFLYITNDSDQEIIDRLSNHDKKILSDRNIKFYVIDAHSLADKYQLNHKISTIVETCIYKLADIIPFDKAYELLKQSIVKNFQKKGQEIVDSNLNAISEALNLLRKIEVNPEWSNLETKTIEIKDQVFEQTTNLKGNTLKVSDFLPYKDGSYQAGTTQREQRGIAETTPHWNNNTCIQCNQCSFVCPHGVIRPFLLNQEEYDNAPESVKKIAVDAIGSDYKYVLNVSYKNCTGCGLCAATCPTGSLAMKKFEDTPDEASEYLLNHVTEKSEMIKPNVKASQFAKPLFEYSGACAGCGETPYLKLLTQLFGKRMVIANATGCSSIYGASFPSTPYSVPWANSLFEDNAEYGYGMLMATDTMRNRIKNLMVENISQVDETTKDLFDLWLNNYDDYEITNRVYKELDYNKVPYLKEIADYIPKRSIWTIGGDGWAYDIGFGGIDQVLSSNDNVNILVLDTQVYSNTGGQSSKASERGSIAKFNSSGKKTAKKDLAKIALAYPNVYVASIAMGANMNQTIKALTEAEAHDGPSLIIAYSPCISHGIKKGSSYTMKEEELAVKSGYVSIFRYQPQDNKFILDYKEPDFNLLDSFFEGEKRFSMLKAVNPLKGQELLEQLKVDAKNRFAYYQKLSQ